MKKRLFVYTLAAAILAGVAAAGASISGGAKTDDDPRAKFEQAKDKKKIGDDTMVFGVWRNCKFHIVKVKTERWTATIDGELQEIEKPAEDTNKAFDEQLPVRDSKCDDVEPTEEQKAKNRENIDAEQAKLKPGQPTRPGGTPGKR